MGNVKYAIAYREVFEILKYIPKADYDKIPSEKIELYKTMQDKNYNFKYDPSKTLDEQNVSKRAKAIIGLLFRDYWATETQKQTILAKQKYERQKIEEEKSKNFQYGDIFKNISKKADITNAIPNNTLIEYKESVFTRILNKIKNNLVSFHILNKAFFEQKVEKNNKK